MNAKLCEHAAVLCSAMASTRMLMDGSETQISLSYVVESLGSGELTTTLAARAYVRSCAIENTETYPEQWALAECLLRTGWEPK